MKYDDFYVFQKQNRQILDQVFHLEPELDRLLFERQKSYLLVPTGIRRRTWPDRF